VKRCVPLAVEELYRLQQIELASRNVFYVFQDLTSSYEAKLLQIICSDEVVSGIVSASLTELAVMLGETQNSPFRRPKADFKS
jgi:hypothetical protein